MTAMALLSTAVKIPARMPPKITNTISRPGIAATKRAPRAAKPGNASMG